MERASTLALLAALLPASAWAWGGEGHQAVCEIAFLELGPVAREAVKQLVRRDGDYGTLRAACNWPDTAGRLQDERRPEHYVNVPRDWTAVAGESCPLAERCLFTALERDSATLRSRRAAPGERVIALRSLGHWVGDVHQPLHVSYRDDRGGNDIALWGNDCADNLHAYWDMCLPRRLMRTLGAATPRELGEALHARITPGQRAAWRAAPGFADWAGESLAIARETGTGYCWVRDGECLPRTGSGVYLGPEYGKRHERTAALRLQQAGVRLGALLDDLLGGP